MEAILKHKGKGALPLYLVMWEAHLIIEASREPELPLAFSSQPRGLLVLVQCSGLIGTSKWTKPKNEFIMVLRIYEVANHPPRTNLCLLGVYTWCEIALGVPNPYGCLYSL